MLNILLCGAALLGGVPSAPSVSASPQTVRATNTSARNYGRILPIGDSITQGVGFSGGWRKMLQERLTQEGIAYTFVGRTDPRQPMPQPNHEGHPTWNTAELLEGRPSERAGTIREWVTRYRPDTVILMGGTNDSTATPASQVQMIADILNVNPAIKVIVGTILPSKKAGPLLEAETENRKGQVMAVEAFRRTGYQVFLAPTSEGFDPNSMLNDNVHPNKLGYEHMTKVYRDTLRNVYGF